MLKQKSFLTFSLNILGSLTGYISLYFVTRYMGPEPLGIVSSILSFINLFAVFNDFGFSMAHVKKVSEGYAFDKCNGSYFLIKTILTACTSIITFCTFYIMQFHSDVPYIDGKYVNVFYVLLISTIITNLVYPVRVTFQATIEKAKEGISDFIQKLVLTISKVLVAVFGLSVVMLAGANLISAIIGATFLVIFFKGYPLGCPDKKIILSYSKFALPIMFIGVVEIIGQNIDKVLINLFSDAANTGFYSAAQSIVSPFLLLSSVFVSLLFPTYSKMFAFHEVRAIGLFAKKTERGVSLLLTPFLIFMTIFADPIRRLFLGNRFADSTTILALLSIQAYLLVISQPYYSQLLAAGKTKLLVIIGVIAVASNAILNCILIPSSILGVNLFGLKSIGAALSLLLSTSAAVIMTRYFTFRLSGYFLNRSIIIHILTSISIFYLLRLFIGSMSVWIILQLAVCFMFGFVLYLFVLHVFNEFLKQDLYYYWEIINLNGMIKYIKEEINSPKR